MINEDGTAMSRQSFEMMWHHIVDHSTWKGLNLTGHSMQIGGSTTRHEEGMDMLEIRQLGRWKDDTVNRYLQPELKLPPESLRRMKISNARREECHTLCACPKNKKANIQNLLKTNYQPGFHDKKCKKWV